MTHSPPIPPANQPPYPIIEPPHAQRDLDRPGLSAPEPARGLAPKLLVGTILAGAAAAVVAAIVRSRREGVAARRPGPKPRRKSAAKTPAAKRGAGAAATRSSAAIPAKRRSSAPAKRTRRTSADDKAIRGPQDAARIAMGEDYEVRYWTQKFGVDRDTLQQAVDAVGNGAKAVEHELGNRVR